MVPFLLISYHVFRHLFRVLLPLSVSVHFLFDVVFVEVWLLRYSFDYQLLQILRKTEKFLLVDRIY